MNKKFVALMLIATLSLTACGSGQKPPSSSEPAPQESSAEIEETESSESSSSEKKEEVESQEEVEGQKEGENSLELGKTVSFKSFDITIKSFSIVKDMDDKPVLKFVYDWTNKGKDTSTPFMSYVLKGFQDGVETDDDFLVMEGLDLGIGQKSVKAGATITDAEGAVGITDMDKPIELELEELFSLDSVKYTMTIQDLHNLDQ
ncbi:DUF5067 domain-containing protein [Kallipyga massiliensis]|uniref:DUF5067 domain-containing protein n=1 Tax=Kallipyga massiliensis TaxID=1472764 RepID=UPI0026F23BE9|nr:DUF5067 domain-containing protein [Kallipyga massiliensis]